MKESDFNLLLDDTLELGEKIIFKDFNENNFKVYQDNLSTIIKNGNEIFNDELRLKTCNILGEIKPESYRLTLLQQIFYSDSKGTHGKVKARNTDKHIKKRYILNINRYIPILKIDLQNL